MRDILRHCVLLDFSWLTSRFENNYIRCAFETGRASSSLEEDWEAGENPALPRNCKRGHRRGPLEFAPGRPEARFGITRGCVGTGALARSTSENPLLASQETGAN
jgi:hypothetical protein